MIIRSKAPLRIGLAGGGSDLSPYSDKFGGAILNATLNMYAYATIRPRNDGRIHIYASDLDSAYESVSGTNLPVDGALILHKGIYNRIVKDYTHKSLSFDLITHVDAPPGSGLGSSSTLVVAILGAFVEWLKLPLGEYDIAQLAFEIERIDCNLPGGKQDQYAATFGGVNFMEFFGDKVIVNPLRIKDIYLNELSYNLLLFHTEVSRQSSEIIESQQKNVEKNNKRSVEAMHRIKEQAVMMKEALLRGEFDEIGKILDYGWQNKKQMANGITNPLLDGIYDTAISAGASGGKISGAGGGGFMVFYCPENNRTRVADALKQYEGKLLRYEFMTNGLTTWSIK